MSLLQTADGSQLLSKGPNSDEFTRALGTALLNNHSIEPAGLERAMRARNQTGERFELVLAKLGLASEDSIVTAVGACLSLLVVKGETLPKHAVSEVDIPPSFLMTNKILPLSFEGNVATVAVVDPFNSRAINSLGYLLGRPVHISLISPSDFEGAFISAYEQFSERAPGSAKPDQDKTDQANEDDVDRLRDLANDAPVVQIVNQIIVAAVERGASDIHIEPQEDGLWIRFRIDGGLVLTQTLPTAMRAFVISRLKIMAQLNIAERRLPQDGRIKTAVRGREIDFRVSTAPTLYGESVVMRILDRSNMSLDLTQLGFAGQDLTVLRAHLSRPNGIILVTGPTGSGKTTTLYAALKLINSIDRKIYTVEDPVEYHLKGVNQLQTHPKIGLDFASALRSILRQDPDVIMIGEIRDPETAKIAIQASLTGHLVLSTLHTNNAASTVVRLLDMGVENYLLASTLSAVIGQRLVRKLCQHCSQKSNSAHETFKRLTGEAADRDFPTELNFKKAVGCPSCQNTGYSGRTTILEVMTLNDQIREKVASAAGDRDIEKIAIDGGMRTMLHHGLWRAARGETTIEEVLRVTTVS